MFNYLSVIHKLFLCLHQVVDCLLAHNEPQAAARWMDAMVFHGKTVYEFVYQNWIEKCDSDSPSATVYWESFYAHLSRNVQSYMNENIVKQLKELLERRFGLKGQFTSVAISTGRCRACDHKLEVSGIKAEQFTALRIAMFERVLTGPDVYYGSNPAEVNRFQKFVQQTGPYDVVIDGLNVAYMRGPGPKENKLKLVCNSIKATSLLYN